MKTNLYLFHTAVDFFPTDSLFKKKLPTGHYLFVKSLRGNLDVQLESVNNLELSVLSNHRDLMLLFHDSLGREVAGLRPKLGVRHIPYSKKLKTYRIGTTNRQGWILVDYQGHTNYFSIKRTYNNTLPARTKRRLLGTFPINHIVSPVFYISDIVKSLFSYPHVSPPGIYFRVKKIFDPKSFDGYMVLNKPKYKPGDTVKLKAFVTTRKGKPRSKDVQVLLTGYTGKSIRKDLGQARPYRPGAYTFEFVLGDSLKLPLDYTYSIMLRDKNYNDYPTVSFSYEQYELKQNFFFARNSNTAPDKPATLFLKGRDSNDLPLFDITAEITVRSKDIFDFYEKTLFVKDTLWTYSQKLDPIGETRIQLPDSIFPKARIGYEIVVAFVNAENERQVRQLTLQYDARANLIEYKLKNDSIYFSSASSEKFLLKTMSGEGTTIQSKEVSLPFVVKVDPYANKYRLLSDGKIIREIDLSNEPDRLEVTAQRTKDSLFVTVQNPRKLPFRYQLFKNNKIIESGNTTLYSVARNTRPDDVYYLSIQYLWGGRPRVQNFDIPFARKPLHIEIDHPTTVFPGQTVDLTVRVRDAFDKPVPKADITAFANTKKFRDSFVQVPSFERFKSRKIFNVFNETDVSFDIDQRLDLDFWKMKLGLDSLAYYHFLFPGKAMFTHFSPGEDSITQVAPFITRHGIVESPVYILFNNVLVHYSGASSLEPYSFRATPKKTDITMRLNFYLVTIKDVLPQEGRKLILSIDLNNPPGNVQVTRLKKLSLSEMEVNKIASRFMMINRKGDQALAYFQQGNNFHVMPPLRPHENRRDEIVGPFSPGFVQYKTSFTVPFDFKPGKTFTFQKDLVDREDIDFKTRIRNTYASSSTPSLKDQVQTEKRIQDYLQRSEMEKTYTVRKYPDNYPVTPKAGSLTVSETDNNKHANRFATFILNLDIPDEYYIFPGNERVYEPLLPGLYQVVVVYNDQQYIKPAPIRVGSYGRTFYNLSDQALNPPDSFSRDVLQKVKRWSEEDDDYIDQVRFQEMQSIRQLYYRESAANVNYVGGRWVSGIVTDGKSPIPGVNVILRGTTNGTVTNALGEYRIYVPANGVLVISFIGYKTEEIETHSRDEVDVNLQEDVSMLSEVVVTAYGVMREARSLASSVRLQGRVAGVSVSKGGIPGVAADSISIKIRGVRALGAGASPLVIIDGVAQSLDDIDPSRITSMEVLLAAQATAIYGAQASNGVILVSTKPGMTRTELLKTKLPVQLTGEASPGSSLRKNFRDDAFWQPRLQSDQHGEAKFKATFPDDITGWNIHIIGMASGKRTGLGSGSIQSFKPLAAQLALPNFLIAGDTAWALGKITNYSPDSVSIVRKATIANKLTLDDQLVVKNSRIDSLELTASGSDSLAVKYAIQYRNYEDGELRKIPVFPIGTKESIGYFASLPNDTILTMRFDPTFGKVRFIAQADMLDVLMEGINILKVYPYECNEQLASKLKALLAEKLIRQFRKEKFRHDELVEKIIKKLTANQHTDGGWSWWGMNKGTLWATIHIAEALRWADKLGFKTKFDENTLRNFIVTSTSTSDMAALQLRSWIFLSEFGEPIEARPIVDSLKKHNKLKDMHSQLLAYRLLQLQGQPVDWKWIEDQKQQTLKGNWYWGETKNSLWNNDVDNTLLVYRMMEKRNPSDPGLIRLLHYFLEKREHYQMNTYASSRIIETILPGLLLQHKSEVKPVLKLNDSTTVTKFPFEITLRNPAQLVISKVGTSPVYLSAYQERWNEHPEKVEKDFVVKTSWQDDRKVLATGKPVKLGIDLHVKKDAEYVMITVPIPAGCSYNSKNQTRLEGEVHREYDLQEVRIYCERLRAGLYHYSIDLLPRYKGHYQLNPAKAEWMYFPVIYGREQMKRVDITGN